jgi:uncharacterized protein (TIGR03083 family)
VEARTEEHAALRHVGRFYEDVRSRIVDLVAGLDEDGTATPLPACPDWSIHDVVAHVTGNCANILSGDLDGVATPAWTAEQVEARKTRTLGQILDEWDVVGPQIAAMADDFPGRSGVQLVADLTVHEHDIRGALGRPGARRTDSVELSLDFFVSIMLSAAAEAFGLTPLEVRAGDRAWVIGTGRAPTGELEDWRAEVFAPKARPAGIAATGTLVAEPFELFRAATGRRSAAQIRGLDWSVEPDPYLPIFGFGPFEIRDADLIE